MHPLALLIIAAGNISLGVIAWLYFKRFQKAVIKHAGEVESRERELKRRVLELQVLRSLGERVGYSLDLRQILEVIIDSLSGLVEFSSVSYMLLGSEGRIILKTWVQNPVPRKFLDQARSQMISAFSAMVNQNLQPGLMDETLTGAAVDDRTEGAVESFFNLPIVVGGQAAALINVSSTKAGLYGDEDTAILYTILGQVSAQASKLSRVIENEKRRLSAMVSSLVDGIVMVDPHFNLLVTNPALANLLGSEQKSFPALWGASLYDVVASVGTRADIEGSIKQALGSQTSVKLPEFEIGNKALRVEVEPVKDKFGYLLGAVVVFHDITAERALQRLREEFTAMMVHELRTPLTTISYSTDMMISDLPKLATSDISQNLEIIKTTASRMLSLVGELLDVAKIESGKFQIVKAQNDLNQLIGEEMMMFKPIAARKGLRLIGDVDKTLAPFLFDRKRVEQSLSNLLSNALKYTDKGSVTISTRKVGEEVKIEVADTGDGISKEDLNKLFSKFEQLGKGKTGEKGGTGLGLVVTKGIVEAHGGWIEVHSEGRGKGSTFSVMLPLS